LYAINKNSVLTFGLPGGIGFARGGGGALDSGVGVGWAGGMEAGGVGRAQLIKNKTARSTGRNLFNMFVLL